MSFTEADKTRFLQDPKAFIDGVALDISSTCYTPSLQGKPDLLTFGEPEILTHGYKEISIGGDYGMQRIPAYSLRKAKSSDAVSFLGYLIEYVPGGTPITVLGNEATVCFTANMNGCTLGIGSQSPGSKSLVVTHSNSKGKGTQDKNTADQRLKASNVVGVGGSLFEAEHYRTTGNNSVTFGYRQGGFWKFAYLPWKRVTGGPPAVSKTYGVRDVTTNTVTSDFMRRGA